MVVQTGLNGRDSWSKIDPAITTEINLKVLMLGIDVLKYKTIISTYIIPKATETSRTKTRICRPCAFLRNAATATIVTNTST
jgi:hypothetical protein